MQALVHLQERPVQVGKLRQGPVAMRSRDGIWIGSPSPEIQTSCLPEALAGGCRQLGILQKWVRNGTPCHLSRTEGNVFVIVLHLTSAEDPGQSGPSSLKRNRRPKVIHGSLATGHPAPSLNVGALVSGNDYAHWHHHSMSDHYPELQRTANVMLLPCYQGLPLCPSEKT